MSKACDLLKLMEEVETFKHKGYTVQIKAYKNKHGSMNYDHSVSVRGKHKTTEKGFDSYSGVHRAAISYVNGQVSGEDAKKAKKKQVRGE